MALSAHIRTSTLNLQGIYNSGIITNVMTASDAGWCARFMARNTKDVKSVHVNFSAVSSPGTMEARVETVDATSGKPTGTLYDANATKSFTPSAGWNTVTFNTLPTTGLTAGTEYAIVLIKSDVGTTCTLNSRLASAEGAHPCDVLTTTSASTRSTFAETAGSIPVFYLTLDDDSVEHAGGVCSVTVSTFGVYGADRVTGTKIVLSNEVTVSGIIGLNGCVSRTGTPAGDLRVRILNSSNSAVSGTTFTIDKESLTGVNNKSLYIPLDNIVLPAGTYRIALDSSGSVDSSNCFSLRSATLPTTSLQESSVIHTESTNASGAFTWTDSQDKGTGLGLMISSVGGGGGFSRSPRFQITQ